MIFGIGTAVAGAATAAAYTAAAGINAAAYTAVNLPRQTAEVVLSGLIGVYSLVRQHQIQRDYLRLAEEQVEQAERYLLLSEDNYNNIAVPTFRCQKDLFDRYLSDFSGRESEFLTDAFKFDEFTPDYDVQEGRALGAVSAAFGRARQQRRRNIGKYNTGRACHDIVETSIAEARASVAAVNTAYRYEEQRKFRFDQWYFQRRTAGVAMVSDMASRVVSGINQGVAGVNSALAGVGSAVAASNQAFQFVENATTNQANFFGSLGRTAFDNGQRIRGRNSAIDFLNQSRLPGGINNSGGALSTTGFSRDPGRRDGVSGGLVLGAHSDRGIAGTMPAHTSFLFGSVGGDE